MKVYSRKSDAKRWTADAQRAGRRVAFVPTMGALHDGHFALVRRALELADDVAVSIFVNPTQFGPGEDFERYPRTREQDSALLASAGAEMVFTPDRDGMYPDGFATIVEVASLTDEFEGALRPGHFRGVTTVVAKLLNIVPADVAVFGQKDYQQLVAIRRMVRDLDYATEIVAHPTVRESDGLAMSSRNRYLSTQDRAAAVALNRGLGAVRALAGTGEQAPQSLEEAARSLIGAEPRLALDYVAVRDPDSLGPLDGGWSRAVCLVAARAGHTRLLDNCVFDRSGREVTV